MIGLGSNLGDRAAWLRRGVDEISDFSEVYAVSGLLETAPRGGPAGQPAFLNAAVLVRDPRPLEVWLAQLLRIEASAGRVRDGRWGPRTLDLDLLWAGSRSVASAELTVPHPRLLERRFALEPLLELVPDAVEPATGAPYRARLSQLLDQEATRLADAAAWCPAFPG